MATIYKTREEARTANPQSVIVSTQLRNPVRYPSIAVNAEVFSNLATIPETYRELLRACLMSAAESVLKTAIKHELTSVDDNLLSEVNLIAEASASASARLSKDEFIAQFKASALGLKMAIVARSSPAMAQRLQSWIEACHSPRACKLGEAELQQLLTVLTKPEYSADTESAWFTQVIGTIETVQARRSGVTIDSAF